MGAVRTVTVYDEEGRHRHNLVERQAEQGVPLVIGREGDLPLGVDRELPDRGVSRQAMRVTATDTGWSVEVGNGRGAWKHPWGLAARRAEVHEQLTWPRVAFRVLGSVDEVRHWVLLVSDAVPIPVAGVRSPSAVTDMTEPPKPLTPPMEEALRTVFAAQLRWPPSLEGPLQLKQAASRLGVSDAAIQQRLQGAQLRALRLGLPREVELTQPSYLHVLVEAGYLLPESADGITASS